MGWLGDTAGWMNDGDAWKPGNTSRSVAAACCPQCGTMDVHHKGAGRAGSSLVYWQCVPCGHRWKMAERSAGRVTSIR